MFAERKHLLVAMIALLSIGQASGQSSPTPSPTETGSPVALGCYADDPANRIMDSLALSDSSMTTEMCELTCVGSTYFATQYGRECWGGSANADYAVHGESSDCTYACAGDAEQSCGGFDAANVYLYPVESTASPTVRDWAGPYIPLGCYEDDPEDRIMDNLALSDAFMTTEVCEMICEASTYFATQYGRECWCGSADADYALHGVSADCTYACSGDTTQTCGGFDAAEVYTHRNPVDSTPSPTASPTEAGSLFALGCYEDDPQDRIMDSLALSDDSMTTELCEQTCIGSTYFATQYGRECWCGLADADYALHGESTDCTYACSGDADQTCGGFDAANVYLYPVDSTPSPTPSPTEAGPYLPLGCYDDDPETRIMDNLALSDDSMTTELCEQTCTGSTYFATQYGRECWCGSADADYALHGESTDCTYRCSGDTDQTCGGFDAANVYRYTIGSTPSPTPSPTEADPYLSIGCYEDITVALEGITFTFALSDSSMTTELCALTCLGHTYFATQYERECWCGSAGPEPDYVVYGESTDCTYAAHVYLYTGDTSPGSSFVGCYQDESDARIMELALTDASSMTMEVCEEECTGNTYFGMQYGTECFCGGESTDLLQHGESNACDYDCSGDSDQVCGGFYAMSVYSYS